MNTSNRRFLLISMSAAVATWLALVTYILWIGFPVVMVTGDYHLGRWLGPSASRIAFEVMALCAAGLYLWVCARGTRPPIDERSWRRGAAAGGVTGLVILVAFLAAGAAADRRGGWWLCRAGTAGDLCATLARQDIVAVVYQARHGGNPQRATRFPD